MNATVAYDHSMNEIKSDTKVYLIEGSFTDGVDELTAASGNVIYYISTELVHTIEGTKTEEEETEPHILEYALHEDGMVTATYDEGPPFS